MKILQDSDLITKLTDSYLFLDTNAYIGALFFNNSLGKLFQDLIQHNCAFLTIPSVLFEFTRGTDTLEDFNKRADFLGSITDAVYPIEKSLPALKNLTVVLQRIRGDMEYTDFLLSACLFKFPKSFLITENHLHFPTSILDRRFLITLDTDKELRNYAIYQFSEEKFNKAAENILRKKPVEEIPF